MITSNLEKRLKRQIIGKPHRFLAIAPLGFEQTLVHELQGFGLEFADSECSPHIAADGKVEFTAKITEAWKAVAYSRIANRILMLIADFKAENFRDLEKKAAEIPWELFLPAGSPTIHVTCKHSRLYHSDAVTERVRKIIDGKLHLADRDNPNTPEGRRHDPTPQSARSARPHPPHPTSHTPHFTPQNLYVTLIDDRCTIWLDLAGEELYKRGHERFVNEAPLKETIAAAMIFEAISISSSESSNISHSTQHTTHPTPHITLIDPMAGSGTFSLEAAYMANGLIPGKCRDFALKHQPAFKPATWNHIVNSSLHTSHPTFHTLHPSFYAIVTSDISEKAVKIIKHNVLCCPLADIVPNDATPAINPQLHDFFNYTAKEIADACGETSPGIVLNPPYGKRLDFDAPKLYTQIGKKLAELSHSLTPLGKSLTVAILAPKDDNRPGSKYTCTANLLHECPALAPQQNPAAKCIATSHGGFSLNVFIAKI